MPVPGTVIPYPPDGTTVYPHHHLPYNTRVQFRDASGQQSLLLNSAGQPITGMSSDRIACLLDARATTQFGTQVPVITLTQNYAQYVRSLGPSWYATFDEFSNTYDLSPAQRGQGTYWNGSTTLPAADAPNITSSPCAYHTKSHDHNNTYFWPPDLYSPFVNGRATSFMGWNWADAAANCMWGSNQSSQAFQLGGAQISFYPNVGSGTANWATAWPGLNQWVHWALIFDEPGDAASLYINGSGVFTNVGFTVQWGTPGALLWGTYNGTQNWDGRTAHASVFERALTTQEIAGAYATSGVA